MGHNKWDARFLARAEEMASWSKDTTKVGAVIVDTNHRSVSEGFNGLPKGLSDDYEIYDGGQRVVIHAELNAILFANERLDGMTLYTYPLPTCAQCAAIIIQKGIARVVCGVPKGWWSNPTENRWSESTKVALGMYQDAMVSFEIYEEGVRYAIV